jgi:hypothetical protein
MIQQCESASIVVSTPIQHVCEADLCRWGAVDLDGDMIP